MDITDKPMESITQWQEWYRKNRVVAQLDEPLVSKDSRENLHETSNVTSVMPDLNGQISLEDKIKQTPVNWQSFTDNAIYKEKAIEHFEDTLAEFNNELSGQEFFDCFKTAATNYYNSQKEELERTKQLIDLLHGNTCKKTCEKK